MELGTVRMRDACVLKCRAIGKKSRPVGDFASSSASVGDHHLGKSSHEMLSLGILATALTVGPPTAARELACGLEICDELVGGALQLLP